MIRVTHDYVIGTDIMNYIVYKDTHNLKRDDKGRSSRYKAVAYMSNLKESLEFIADRMTKEELEKREYTIQEAVAITERCYKMISDRISTPGIVFDGNVG